MFGITRQQVAQAPWRLPLTVKAVGAGNASVWPIREAAVLATLLRVRRDLGGQIPAAVAAAVADAVREARWGAKRVNVPMSGRLTMTVTPVWGK